jgi:hypothetical protein
MGRVNAQHPNGQWFTTLHLPTGRSVVLTHMPTCEPGPRTAAVLRKYADAL